MVGSDGMIQRIRAAMSRSPHYGDVETLVDWMLAEKIITDPWEFDPHTVFDLADEPEKMASAGPCQLLDYLHGLGVKPAP